MAKDTNLAYALRNFETQEEVQPQRERKITTRTAPKTRTVSPISVLRVLLCAIYVIGLAGGLLYARVVLTQQNDLLLETQTQLEVLQDEAVRLNLEMTEQMSLQNISDQAMQDYDMHPLSQSQTRYVVVEQDNKMETIVRDESIFDKIYQYYLDIKEYIFG